MVAHLLGPVMLRSEKTKEDDCRETVMFALTLQLAHPVGPVSFWGQNRREDGENTWIPRLTVGASIVARHRDD